MDHHDKVGPTGEGVLIAGLLVSPIPEILFVSNNGQSQSLGNFDRVIATAVIDQNDFIDRTGRNIRDGSLQRPRRVVGGHDRNRFAACRRNVGDIAGLFETVLNGRHGRSLQGIAGDDNKTLSHYGKVIASGRRTHREDFASFHANPQPA